MREEQTSNQNAITSGADAELAITITSIEQDASPNRLRLTCLNSDGVRVWDLDTGEDQKSSVISGLTSQAVFKLPRINLAPGNYSIHAELLEGQDILDRVESALSVRVMPGDFYRSGRHARTRGASVFLDYQLAHVS